MLYDEHARLKEEQDQLQDEQDRLQTAITIVYVYKNLRKVGNKPEVVRFSFIILTFKVL
jgi:hypothetical protein